VRTSAITQSIQIYFKVTKPNVWWLLVFVGAAGYFSGSNVPPNFLNLFFTIAALILGSAGAETIANYLERDIDAVMERTKKRPLPMGLISPPENAFALGLAMVALSLLVSLLLLNIPAFLVMLLGILDYVIVYVILTKRRTAWNIVLGSPAGAAPVLVGYAAASGVIDSTALLLGSFVMLWIPSHVWSLALKYKEDYVRAGIPMLPTVTSEKTAVRCIAGTVILLVASSLLLPIISLRFFTAIYLAAATLLGTVLIVLSLLVLLKPSRSRAWRLFKFTSPYLAVLYGVIIVESLLGLLNA